MHPTYGGREASIGRTILKAAAAEPSDRGGGDAARPSARPLERDIVRLGSRGGTHLTEARVRELVARVRDPTTPVDLRTVEAVEHLERCQEQADAYDLTEYFEQMPKIHRLLVAVASEYGKRRVDGV